MSGAVAEIIAAAPVVEPEPPRSLYRALPAAQPFPLDALGPVLRPAAEAIYAKVQAPPAICAQSVLATATLAVQAHADVLLPYGQRRPVSAYFLTVAASGERKTATDAEALAPVRTLEGRLHRERDAKLTDQRNAREVWESERKRILNSKVPQPDKRAALDDLGPEPLPPLEALLTCPEPTYEGLTRLFASGRPSLGLFSNEGGQFIGGHGLTKEQRTKTTAGLSSLWDGEPLRRVRAGDGTLFLPGRRLAAHLMAQPEIAADLLGDAKLEAQGFLARLLVVAPETTAGTRLYREETPATAAALTSYWSSILGILERSMPLREGTRNELEVRTIALDARAARLWEAFYNDVERQQAPGEALAMLRPFAAKAAEHVARLGGVLALVENLDAAVAGERHVSAAVALVEHYLAEWLRLQGTQETRPELLRAEALRVWLQRSWRDEVIGLPEIYQSGPYALRDSDAARQAARILEEHGWLVALSGGARIGGHQRREAWRIVRTAGTELGNVSSFSSFSRTAPPESNVPQEPPAAGWAVRL